jgi:adhesin/invasin
LFSIYGTNLGAAAESAPSFPLPTTLGGVSVLVNGTAIPLTYVSPTQINAQMPFGLAPGRATVAVRNAGGVTEAASVEIGAAGPAILEYGSRRAVATSATAVLNTNEAPAAAGDVVIVYLTGIGTVDPAVPSGAAAPLDALSRAVAPSSATIGGRPAQILFLGLAPGFAGLAQANLIVPELPAGTHPVEITVGGARSNTPAISVR